ncbi:MAG: APC family permease [Candidatus Thermoplasmatota archaeon]|nr:APC family permease [Candidatus Thermoplasmatota archaeon]
MVDELDIEKGSTLKRKFTLFDAALFGIGGAIGSGILFAAAFGTAYAGAAVIISWIIAAIMIVIVTIPYAEFSSMAPRAGISARISYYSYGTYGGFLSGWALFLWAVMIPPIEAVAVSEYAAYYVPALYSNGFLTPYGIGLSILITVVFVFINLAGISKLGKFNSALTWIKIGSVITLIIMVPLVVFHPSNFTVPSFLPTIGWKGVFIAIPATGILFSFGGYRQVADMAGEIKNPKRNVPLAIGITLAVQSIFYILMSIVIIGSVNWNSLHASQGQWGAVAGLSSPLAILMQKNLSTLTGDPAVVLSGLIFLALIFAIYSPLGTFGVYLTGSSRIIFGFSREDAMPKVLGKTDKRGVPVYAIVLVAIIGDLFLIPLPSWESLVNFVVVAAVVNFALVAASIPIIRKLHPNVERSFKVPAFKLWSLIAFVVSSLLVYWAMYPTTLYAISATLLGSIVFLYQASKMHWKNLGIKNSIWIPIYLLGLLLISYIGSDSTGGIGILHFPYDVFTVIIYGIAFWFISQAMAPKVPVGDMEALILKAPKEEPMP